MSLDQTHTIIFQHEPRRLLLSPLGISNFTSIGISKVKQLAKERYSKFNVTIADLPVNISQCTREAYWFNLSIINAMLKDTKPKQIRPGQQLDTMRRILVETHLDVHYHVVLVDEAFQVLERSHDDSCSIESIEVEDHIEKALRLANEKQRKIGSTLLDRAEWFERVLCRQKQPQIEVKSVDDNPVLCWDLSMQRKSTRSEYSRYKYRCAAVIHDEDDLPSVASMSPNREDECRPSVWGYDSWSLTDSMESE